MPVFRESERGEVELVEMIWGFIPAFIKEEHPKLRPINARAETVHTKPYFREAIEHHRCVLPATGYYEWQREAVEKTPYHIHLPSGRGFFMAGIWSYREGIDEVPTVAILTTAANSELEAIHDRQPAVIPHKLLTSWLEAPSGQSLLPFPPGAFVAERIGTKINSARYEGPSLIQPIRH